MEILRLLMQQKLDPKRAGLLPLWLADGIGELKRTAFEPQVPTTVVIDPEMERPIGATACQHGARRLRRPGDVLRATRDGRRTARKNMVDRPVLLDRLGLPEIPGGEPQPL
jgi:hypothetical protein